MTIYILGGGPTGAALAQGLCDNDTAPFVLIEREARLGGMAQTVTWEGIGRHDLGPHKIFSLDKALMERVKNLLPPDDWRRRMKSSRVFHCGHYMAYPPGPVSMLQTFGWAAFARMMMDFSIAKMVYSLIRRPPASFDEDLHRRLGATLYKKMFVPMAEKLWDDPKRLDAELSRSRVQLPGIIEILLKMAGIKKEGTFEALDFFYPRHGLQTIWDAIEKTIRRKGDVRLQHEVVAICGDASGINRIECTGTESGEKKVFDLKPGDMVFNTTPIHGLPDLFDMNLPESIGLDLQNTLKLNDLYLVCLAIEEKRLFQDSWIFVPDPAVLFHRVSEQASFSPEMTPDGSVVMCEVMNSRTRPVADIPDNVLAERCLEGLRLMGFSPSCREYRVLRLPRSYALCTLGFQEARQRVIAALDRINRFKTIGRAGAFQYIGTLDAMDIGFGAADWAAAAQSNDGDILWSKERQRTSFYPVLD